MFPASRDCKKNLTNAVLADDWCIPCPLPTLPPPATRNGIQEAPHVSAADAQGTRSRRVYDERPGSRLLRGFLDDFLQQLAAETGLLEASVAQDGGHGVGDLTYQAWSLSLSEPAQRAATLAEAWQAGATAMFQALVERGYIAPDAVERALTSTVDVLTT